MLFQRTLKNSIEFNGIGVHSGQACKIIIKPAAENTGIIFKKIGDDSCGSNSFVSANYDNVIDTRLCTVIGDGTLKFSTIEHLMSALWGVGIDNAIIECSSEELAIMDGSSAPFVETLEAVGVVEQKSSPRKYLKILKETIIEEGGKFVKLSPSDVTSYKCSIDFDHPSIGYQEIVFEPHLSDYKREVSYARTFGFASEIEELKQMGLARGGSLENAVGVDEHGVMNPEGLRYYNEFVRHKLLDLIGDLFLTGYRFIAKIEGHKCGHYLNNMVLKKLFATPENFTFVELKN